MLAHGLQHFAVSSFPANPPIGKTVFLSQASGDKQPGLYVWEWVPDTDRARILS